MQPWVVEYGTLWALDTNDNLPPIYTAQVEVVFEEVGVADIDDLAVAMNQPVSEIWRRLQNRRRCFALRVASQIATYGWVTHGVEYVGELERQFHFSGDETYVWDCGTVAAWRRYRCYSALLSHIVYQLHAEGRSCIWIGASRRNQPSIQGFANAGFRPILDVTYRRLYHLTSLWFNPATSTSDGSVEAAYRILLNDHERRFGPVAIGYQ